MNLISLRVFNHDARIRASMEFGLERAVRQIRELYESLLF